MGATEILKALAEGEELTSAEIAEKIDASLKAVRAGIGRLCKDISENVEHRILTPDEKLERYGKNLNLHKIFVYYIA